MASLGFFACGVNNNLTTSGGPVWLAGIPSWARAEVYYRTTEEGGFFACQIFTALLLANPEDGTTERSRGQLPGAQNEGHASGVVSHHAHGRPAPVRGRGPETGSWTRSPHAEAARGSAP